MIQDEYWTLCEKGKNSLKSGEYPEAWNYFDEAISLQPNIPRALLYKAVVAELLNDLDNTIICIKRAIELNPKFTNMSPFYFMELKNIFAEQVCPSEEIEIFYEVLSLFPNKINGYHFLSVFCSEIPDIINATVYIKRALELDPDHKPSLNFQLYLKQNSGKFPIKIFPADQINKDMKIVQQKIKELKKQRKLEKKQKKKKK